MFYDVYGLPFIITSAVYNPMYNVQKPTSNLNDIFLQILFPVYLKIVDYFLFYE